MDTTRVPEGILLRSSNAGRPRFVAFTEDGVYQRRLLWAFKGREKIAEMVNDWFIRTAREFRWGHASAVSHRQSYTPITLSDVSEAAEAMARRVGFEGVRVDD